MSDPTAPRTYHWRRHDDTVEDPSNRLWLGQLTASACGRLVDYEQAVGDASEADCSECQQVDRLLRQEAADLELVRNMAAAGKSAAEWADEMALEVFMRGCCLKCGAVVEITHETAQAVHLETGLCKACIRG